MSTVSGLDVTRRCPNCGQRAQRTQYSGAVGFGDICETHGWVQAAEMVPLADARGAVSALDELRVILDDTEAYGDAIEQLRAIRMRLITAPSGGQS